MTSRARVLPFQPPQRSDEDGPRRLLSPPALGDAPDAARLPRLPRPSAAQIDRLAHEPLKRAIVRTLRNRPNESCTLHTLPREVAHQLGFALPTGAAGRQFLAQISRAVSALLRTKALPGRRRLVRYRVVNERVRLVPTT